MSASRAVTPRLKKYLTAMDLSQYTTNLEQFGMVSVSTICCLPSEEDTTFIKQLNINQSDAANWIKFRVMVNEIRRDFTNAQNIIQNDNKNTIDLTKPEPITNFNINDERQITMETDRNNNENDTHDGTNEKHFMELLSKYGTKPEYE
eukprot:245108_1